MTEALAELLQRFDRLSEDDRRLAVQEMLKRVKTEVPNWDTDLPPLDDDTISQIGDEVFRMYDEEERRHGAPEPW